MKKYHVTKLVDGGLWNKGAVGTSGLGLPYILWLLLYRWRVWKYVLEKPDHLVDKKVREYWPKKDK